MASKRGVVSRWFFFGVLAAVKHAKGERVASMMAGQRRSPKYDPAIRGAAISVSKMRVLKLSLIFLSIAKPFVGWW